MVVVMVISELMAEKLCIEFIYYQTFLRTIQDDHEHEGGVLSSIAKVSFKNLQKSDLS